ncbi:MAG: glycosyltransferase [Burkholderiales bacterium]|nr:MAG: glycosyltransferase [Burkholderiales bacterium]
MKRPPTPWPQDAPDAIGARAVPTLAIVIPCYDEEAVVTQTCAELCAILRRLETAGKIAPGSHLLFVDDGSRDGTWDRIESFAESGLPVAGLRLGRNRGHQNALLCGLEHSTTDVTISMDADLQDDPQTVEAMIDAHARGFDVVYGVRASRACDTKFKRSSARTFYRLLEALGVETVPEHADFRLMSRRAIGALAQFREVNVYLRGIVPLLGLRSICIEYERRARHAGESKYPLSKMLALAWQAITSFSVVPLRIVTLLGFVIFSGSVLVSAWVLWARFVGNSVVPGWASTVLPMFLLGGMQMLGIGVVGEYLGKIYLEAKRRPRYVVEDSVASTVLHDALRGGNHPRQSAGGMLEAR